MATLEEDWGLLGQPVALVTTLPGPQCKGTESREWGQGRCGEEGGDFYCTHLHPGATEVRTGSFPK